MAVNKEDNSKALLDVYFALKVGSTLKNDESWVLWDASDADKKALLCNLKEMTDQFDEDLKKESASQKGG